MHDSCCDALQTRRQFFGRSALGLAPMALASLFADERSARGAANAGAWKIRSLRGLRIFRRGPSE